MSTMSLPQLIDALIATDIADSATIRNFIQEFTAIIEGTLARGESVSVKGIGTFHAVEVADELYIEFAPDATLGETVNAPFSIFEPVELPDNLTDADMETADMETAEMACNETEPASQPCPPPIPPRREPVASETVVSPSENTPPVMASDPAPSKHDAQDAQAATTPVSEPAPDPIIEAPVQPEHAEPEHKTAAPGSDNNEPEQAPKNALPTKEIEKIIEHERVVEVRDHSSHHTLHIVIASLLSLVAGLAIGFFANNHLNLSHIKNVNIEAEGVNVISKTEAKEGKSATADSLASVAAGPSDSIPADTVSPGQGSTAVEPEAKTVESSRAAIVTDTVKANRYLTTMARRHYGKKIFWVYIYEENKNIIDDPDHIAPNTVVVIPPAEKYGIKAGDKESEADAMRRAQAIVNSQK